MADKIHGFLPATAEMPTDRQRLFVRYLTGTLIDLVVLNLFAQYWLAVHVDSFSISLLAAVVLQVLLKLAIAAEHQVADFFNARQGGFMKFMRYVGAWFVLFASKFVILEALSFIFGSTIHFDGRWHGIIPLIIVVVTMLIAEEVVVRIYRKVA
jgi:hypothetical protein